MSLDGDLGKWEIQHFSLPWGWLCEEGEDVNFVEALVPGECFRYESDPHLHPKTAEKLWYSTGPKKHGRSNAHEEKLVDINRNTSDAEDDDLENDT